MLKTLLIGPWKKNAKNINFSSAAMDELNLMSKLCISSLDYSIDCFSHYTMEKAMSVRSIEGEIDSLEKSLKSSHIRRLNTGVCSATVGAMFLDIISNLERLAIMLLTSLKFFQNYNISLK